MSAEKLISDMQELMEKIKQLAEIDKEAALKQISSTTKLFDGVVKECNKELDND